MNRIIEVRGGPHHGCHVRVVPAAAHPVLWLPERYVDHEHAVYAFERSDRYPLQYRLVYSDGGGRRWYEAVL